MVYAGNIKRRDLEDGDDIPRSIALKVLISRASKIFVKAVVALAEKCRGAHLRVDGLRKSFRKTLAEDVRTQVLS